MIKNFFRNIKIVFHDLDSFIRNDVHVSKKVKIGLLIFISILTILYVANYFYIRSYERTYDSVTVLVNNGEYRKAHERLISILEQHPNDPYFLILDARANIGMSQGNLNIRVKRSYLARSTSLLKKAEEINPKIVEIYRLRGLTYMYLGEFSLAELAYKKMLTLNDDSSKGWVDLGNVYLLQGNITEAGNSFTKASNLDPNNEQALIGSIKILALQNRFDRVINLAVPLYIKVTDKGIKLQLAEIIGNAYSKLTEYDQAKKYLNEGLTMNPNSVAINYIIAEVSFYSSFNIKDPVGSTDDAKRRANNVITLDTSYPFSYGLLTRIASVSNKLDDYNKYLELTKDKIKDYAFMNQSQKDAFIKSLPLFNKASGNVTLKVRSVKSVDSQTQSNTNALIRK